MNRKNKVIITLIMAIIVGSCLGFGTYRLSLKYTNESENESKNENEIKTDVQEKKLAYKITGNSLDAFDLYFLQLENNNKNMIYSPLSIKYALGMLSEGTSGESKTQIDSIIGNYKYKKYINNKNMSFANAFFVKDTYKNSIKQDYITILKNKYNAEIVYDNFSSTNNINKWISNKTLSLINNLFDDVSSNDYILLNSLAINMEWKNLIQPAYGHELYDKEHSLYGDGFYVVYPHETFSDGKYLNYFSVSSIIGDYYETLSFNNKTIDAKSVEIGASINNYDIVKDLGEENIRKTVGEAYEEWVKADYCESGSYVSTDIFLDNYIKELDSNYKDVASSTDFRFYVDDDTKVFAKELKEYDGVTLEYIGIMPKKENLNNYIKNIDIKTINNLINNLKTVELNNFKEGVITHITGKIPLFKYDYKLQLLKDLKKLGIINVFEKDKADLSNFTTDQDSYINETIHQATIEFSNEGIKAAAATGGGGAGDTGCVFDYEYSITVETIDLTFDNPYLYLIRDKDSGEVWFMGTVYNPIVNDR